MNEDRNKIIEKIKKLLAMSEGGTKYEKETAYFQAQRLLAKYHIQMNEVEKETKEEVLTICLYEYNVKNRLYARLQTIIARNFRCEEYVSYSSKSFISPVFLGFKTDIEIAVEVFKSAYNYAKNEASRLSSKEYYRTGESTGVRGDFIAGFITGLEIGFEEQIQKSKETALMIVVPKEVNEAMEDKRKSFVNDPISFTDVKRANNSSVYIAGIEKGKLFAHGKKQQELDFRFTKQELDFLKSFKKGYLYRNSQGEIFLSTDEPVKKEYGWKSFESKVNISELTDLIFNGLKEDEFINIEVI